jgi:hypothetical protein
MKKVVLQMMGKIRCLCSCKLLAPEAHLTYRETGHPAQKKEALWDQTLRPCPGCDFSLLSKGDQS